MVSNQGKITTLAADANVDKGLVDGTDKLHSGIIKVLESFAQGDMCIGHAGFTITDGGDYTQYNLAQPIEYTAKGEYDSYGTNLTVAYSSTVQDATNSRYDWVLLNPSVGGTPSIVIVQGTAGTTPLVSDITADHIPIALVHISAGNDDDKTDYSFQTFTLDKGKNSLSILHGGNQIGKITGDTDSIDIVSTVTDSDINITPNGNGKIVLDGLNWPIADGSANQFLQTDGSNQLSFATVDLSTVIAHTDIPDSDTGFVKRTGVETYDIDTNTYLTVESDTLDTVTGRGDSTANDITCGTITSNDNQHISFEVIDTSNPVISGGKTVVYVHDISSLGNTLQLPVPNSGSVLYIMNFFSNTITLTGNPEINAADTTHPKIVSANTIQLEPFEHVTLQATDDSVAPLSTGHYIISDGDKDRSASYATAAQGTTADTNATAITAINTKAHMFMSLSTDMANLTSGTAQHILYDTTEYDIGSNYNSTKDAFIAPRDGYYLVDVSFYLNLAPTWSFSIIQKSTDGGTTYKTAVRNVSGSGQQNKLFAILQLDANDEIRHQAVASFSSGTYNVEKSLEGSGYSNPTLTYFRVSELV